MTTSLYPPSSLNSATITSLGTSFPTANSGRLSRAGNTVCLGHGLDSSVDGLLVTIALSGLLGFFLWVRCIFSPTFFATSYTCQFWFALVRPHCRQIYGLREWFVQERCVCSTSLDAFALILQRLRPTPLRPTLWAFFKPPVPVVPSISNVPSSPADPAASDARRFPSDEELSQRTLWFCFLIAVGWSILGLAGALPLYMISMPCLAHTAPTPRFVGGYSTLQDLSILRVLMLLDNPSSGTSEPEVVVGQDLRRRARVRIIILTALLIVLGLIPALVKILREYGNLVAFRRKWTDIHLEGKEMGWISASEAPGFAGWGEKRLKDFILKTGLSSSLDFSAGPANGGTGRGGRSGRRGLGTSPYMLSEEDVRQEVDILSLFTIV